MFESKFETSFGPKARIYTLANCITSQAIENSKTIRNYLDQGKQNFNIGCIIANQYGIREMDCEDEKLRLIKEMPHVVPSIVAMKHKLRGHISAPSLSSGAGLAALG